MKPIEVVITTRAPQTLEEALAKFQYEMITSETLAGMRYQVESFLREMHLCTIDVCLLLQGFGWRIT